MGGLYLMVGAPALAAMFIAGTTALVRTSSKPRELRGRAGALVIAVVGFKGAGKTLLLSSSVARLMVLDGSGVSVIPQENELFTLESLRKQIKGEDGSITWPDATLSGPAVTTPLTVTVRTNSGEVFDVLRINYLDYSGESLGYLFQRENDMAAADVLSAIKGAHAVLGVIDGFKLKRHLEGVRGEQPDEDFAYQMRTMLHVLMKLQRPVHLILTKWDMLQPQYTLRQVVDHLMQVESFRRFAEVTGQVVMRVWVARVAGWRAW